METIISSQKLSISKKDLATILGGETGIINIICPICQGKDWEIKSSGTTTTIVCLNCDYERTYPQ